MRARWLAVVLASAIGGATMPLAGCGPSAGQVREARAQRYLGDRAQVFDAVAQALAQEQPIAKADRDQGVLTTDGRWFTPDGFHEDRPERTVGGEREVVSTVREGSVRLAYDVRVVGGPSSYQVVVTPVVAQYRVAYKALYPMKPDDPEMPGWVAGKVEKLEIALHRRLERARLAPPGLTR